MNKLQWLIKQLIPRTYWTKYTENGKEYFEIWNMWFGISYNSLRVELK